MKRMLLGLMLVLSSASAFAHSEVVCESSGSNPADPWAKANGDVINSRVKFLESKGLNVEITQLSTSTAVAEARAGTVNFDKTCAVLKY
jgi:hypothetical protein